jgi:Flp pilus assembly protein TadD
MNMIRIAVLTASVILVGCQTSKVDTMETTSIDDQMTLAPVSDLAQGKEQFLDANYGLAEKHFRKAVEQRPEDAESLMGLAASYDQLGRFDLAERTYQQLFKVAGRKPQIVSNYGYSQLLRGEKSKARTLFQEAAKAMPESKKIQANKKLAS